MALHYFLIAVIELVCIGSITSSIVTKYTRVSQNGSFDISLCMDILDNFDVCGLRLTNTTCEQVGDDWCESTPVLLNDYTYLKKSEITEFPEATNFTHFDRYFPINYTIGSEVEIRFAWHAGCTGFRINLNDDVGNFVLHVCVNENEFFSSSKTFGMSWDGYYGFRSPAIYSTIAEVQYTLKIVRGINGFLVCMNGVEEWEHPYDSRYSPQNIILFDSKFKGGVQGDVYRLTFRPG
ncbi:hypothetical protein ACF0H5_015318 [Mactra antiquata]